ncbi:MAG: hypothetical protein FWE61_02865, partial [Micrococcales bacterium]|nr:hypothetical protein [Micrococcales bacterium]
MGRAVFGAVPARAVPRWAGRGVALVGTAAAWARSTCGHRGRPLPRQWVALVVTVVLAAVGVVGVVQSSRAETLTNGGWSIGSHFSTLDQTWTVYAYALAGETVTFTTVVGEQSSSAG